MKKNKGFTLIELLAVIAILALLITIAVPSVIALSKRIKWNMFCTKVENIESAAKIYGNDNLDIFGNDGKVKNGNNPTVATLINNNVYKKEKNGCSVGTSNPCVTDPRNGNSLDNKTIVLEKRDKQIIATYDYGEYAGEDEKAYCQKR